MTPEQKSHCVFYRDLFGGWRWEWRDAEGHIRDSQQSYDSRDECVQAARRAGICTDGVGNGIALSMTTKRTPLAGRSILCAHPDPQLQAFLKQTLAAADVVFAATGREAITSMNGKVFDAFVLDYWLPDWSGVSLCRDVRKTDPHVPICFYSKARSEDAMKRGLRAGADLFLTVPLDPQALRGRVETLLVSRDSNLLRAQAEEQRAIQAELSRRAEDAKKLAEHARESAARAIERTTRTKAVKAFVDAGGTRAHFERLWPQLYSRELSSPPAAPGISPPPRS
jgi:DNA-binding response OmpR family regulator